MQTSSNQTHDVLTAPCAWHDWRADGAPGRRHLRRPGPSNCALWCHDRPCAGHGGVPLSLLAPDGSTAGFARLITDYTVFAYLRDVFTLPQHRGKGLAAWLALTIRSHPELVSVSNWMLATRDAHGVYARAGYQPVPHPEWYMTFRS